MKPKISGTIAIVIGIAILIGYFALNFEEKRTENVFHVTLADPVMYENGLYTDSFEIEKGRYYFGFVPNGDSPQIITITMQGLDSYIIENYELVGNLHDAGISEYYTWNYVGGEGKLIEISSSQQVQIIIDPHGSTNGPVSVELIKIQ